MTNYYDEIAKGYDELHFEEQKRKAEIIIKELKLKKTDVLLDVGCGTGKVTELFPCKVWGIDPSAELLKKAKIPHIIAKAELLPFEDHSFDVVISLTAIHHTDVDKALSEMKRVAIKKIVISVLKKAKNFKQTESKIKEALRVTKTTDDEHDMIYFCDLQRNV